MEIKIAAAYIRVSTDDQLEYSPDSQLKVIRDQAQRDGYMIPEDLIFREDGISGKKAEKRPRFMLLIARAKEPDPIFDRIYVWEFSRFARNQEESIMYKNLLRKRGITVQSIKEPLADSPFASLIERIIEWMDEYYLINLAEEIRRGLTEKVSRGEPIGAAPFGYTNANKTYIVNEAEAETVRWIFNAYLSGNSITGIARQLNEHGFRTRNGNKPERRFVKYVLENPAYIGKLRWSGEGRAAYSRSEENTEHVTIYDSTHEPIIAQKDFEAVQQRLARNAESTGSWHAGEDYMLRRLIRCSACGATLTRIKTGAGDGLQCVNYEKAKCSVSHYITMRKAEEAVLSYLERIIISGDYTFAPLAEKQPPKQAWDKMISAEQRRIDRAREAYLDGTFSAEEYREARKIAEENMARLQSAQIASESPNAKKSNNDAARKKKRIASVLKLLRSHSVDPTAKNEALHSIIDHIIFNRPEKRMEIFFRE